jgi:transcription-repair coupling factor (superfamily II helicase)
VDARQPLTPQAERRLEVMRTLDHLGAGFTLASHDMDIRGAGNLLGDEQSGHIKDIGVELYQHMLENAIATAKAVASDSPPPPSEWMPQLNLGVAVQIPEDYVRDLDTRMSLYQRIAHLPDAAAAEALAVEMIDRFGRLPEEVSNLLALVDLKRLCRAAGVVQVDVGSKGIVIGFHHDAKPDPLPILNMVQDSKGAIKLRPDEKLVFLKALPDAPSRLQATKTTLGQLAALLAGAGCG